MWGFRIFHVPLRRFVLVMSLTILAGFVAGWSMANTCEYPEEIRKDENFAKWRRFVYRGEPPGVEHSVSVEGKAWVQDLGMPLCMFSFRYNPVVCANVTDHLTLSRPFSEQNKFGSPPERQCYFGDDVFRPCDPVPYADGTPHFFEVVWKEECG